MSKSNVSGSVEPQSSYNEEEINKAGLKALENGELTDLMGNPLEPQTEIQVWDCGEETPLEYKTILNVLKGLQGKVLTIVDATFVDTQRVKYVKDLIKDAFSSQADWAFELTHDGITRKKAGSGSKESKK